MKKIFFILLCVSSSLLAQDYDKNWNKVIRFESEGKIKSANESVAKIHKKAISDKNEVQIIKCFFYESKYLQVVDENAQTKILNNLKAEIHRASLPTKAILNWIYAKCLNDYFYQNNYLIRNRTNLVSLDDDFLTWTTQNFDTQIEVSLQNSLADETILKSISLSKYEAIFDFFALEKFKNENLHAYLVQENIAFYTQKLESWAIASKDFESYEKALLGNPEDFIALDFDFVKDANLRKVLQLLQKLERLSPTPEQQLKRMQFCNLYLLKSDFSFLKSLETAQKRSQDLSFLQKIQLEKATLFAKLASKETHPDYNIKALSALDSILTTQNNSNSYPLALQKKQEITRKSINVQLQKYVYANENSRAFIRYKNVEKIRISFYKISLKTVNDLASYSYKNDSIANSIVQKNAPIATAEHSLVNKKDYFEYTTEVLLSELNIGNYLVYFESDSEAKDKKAFGYETLTVSNLAVLAWQKEKKEFYQVLDRKTGNPIANVRIKSPTFSIETAQNGVAVFERKTENQENYRYENLEITHENDSLQFGKNYLTYQSDYAEKTADDAEGKVQFYLDRAIYRPGQTVFYKGIAIQKTPNITQIVAQTSFKISVKDANNQEIKTFDVVTNEFGSFSGEFVLPKTGLTGSFSIHAKKPDEYEKDKLFDVANDEHPFWDNVSFQDSQVYFRVEEYKRPKFEVVFEPKKETFQINQTIKIKGNAKAFAGSSISDAKVIYTVTRFTSYFRYYYDREQSETIASGETKTDASGNFAIEFVAKPSANAVKEQLPVFNYRINASVTDSNGETRSAETISKVGYHDLALKLSVPNAVTTNEKSEITFGSTNLNGEFLAAKGEIKLYFVRGFSDKFKNRQFLHPEIESISKADFERLFPFENNEKPLTEKDLGTLVFSKKIDTEKDKKLLLDFISNYQSGNYKLVFSAQDSFGNTIESSSDFQIFQSKDKSNFSQLITVKQVNTHPLKDGFSLLKITAAVPELYLSIAANYENKLFFEDHQFLKNGELIVRIPIKNTFEKTIKIGLQCLFENQNFTQEIEVQLPKELPKLEFLVESFRNKIQPGSAENWSFQLKAKNTSKEAEILASMYDSSLDQFTKQDWNGLDFYNHNGNYLNYKTALGFETIYSEIENWNTDFQDFNFRNEETSLKWFGFDFTESNYGNPVAFMKDKKVGSETIIGDANAVISVTESVGNGTAAVLSEVVSINYKTKVDQVKFVKPIQIRGNSSLGNAANALYIVDGVAISEEEFKLISPSDILSIDVLKDEKARSLYGEKGKNGVIVITTKKALEALTQVKARKNLSETAFFFPNLKTDAKGKLSFNFSSPEALTAWKLRLLAHNKAAVSGYLEESVLTQKELMLTPNFPRFFREKDSIVITAKVANMTQQTQNGIAILQLFDAATMQPIDAKMGNTNTLKNFTAKGFGNATASWKIHIPEGLQGVQYKILAKAGNFSDGEENILPVLTNNMLVTESIPIWVRENSKKEYTFENLKNNPSTSLKNHQFTLEYTSNPSWLAVQSLPYLMEFEHECAEQTFARFYANALATEIISSHPKLESLFESWRKNGKLQSKLEENEELKSMILAETPWLNDAQNEDEKKKNLALLFDLEKMKSSQEATFAKLKQKQKPSGGFAWFDGGTESDYISRHILAGFGHLRKLNKNATIARNTVEIANSGIPFIDNSFFESYKKQQKNQGKSDKIVWGNPNLDLHYLYARSFYLEDYPLSDSLKVATKKYLEHLKEHWLNYSLYEKGLASLALKRFGEAATAKKIIESLKETASNNEDWGMYWIANKAGWYWHQAPIETQALLMEAFAEVGNDTKSVDAMKVWLLKNKQSKNWASTKATTEAVYALLLQGSDWLSVKDNTIFKIGNEKILTKKLSENQKEAETGYLKLQWKSDEIKKEMATIRVENKSEVAGFGGLYWQYFEDLDKIKTNSGAVLSVSKTLFIKRNSDKGEKLEPITTKNPLKIGDLVTVQLVISAKEDMEFVHLKDMRASCFEPVNVLSEYRYKGGLGFYQSTKDAATHFFFDSINKGTYVLEYEVRVNNLGDFSNGITTIESMYAPEFSSHSKGIRVKVRE